MPHDRKNGLVTLMFMAERRSQKAYSQKLLLAVNDEQRIGRPTEGDGDGGESRRSQEMMIMLEVRGRCAEKDKGGMVNRTTSRSRETEERGNANGRLEEQGAAVRWKPAAA